MSNTNPVKTRILLKTGTTSDWEQASEHGFVPLPGEFCIYTDYFVEQDDEENEIVYPGLKIGDGTSTIGELPFLEEKSISNEFIDGLFVKKDS
jgi:hypothetical protein